MSRHSLRLIPPSPQGPLHGPQKPKNKTNKKTTQGTTTKVKDYLLKIKEKLNKQLKETLKLKEDVSKINKVSKYGVLTDLEEQINTISTRIEVVLSLIDNTLEIYDELNKEIQQGVEHD